MTKTHRFKNDPAAVTAARRFALEALAGQGLSLEVAETAELLVSELASNCVRHTDSGFVITVEILPGEIRVAATDSGAGEPVMRKAGPADVSGRGLAIVDMLASSWGVEPVRGGPGKSVWLTLTVDVPEPSLGH